MNKGGIMMNDQNKKRTNYPEIDNLSEDLLYTLEKSEELHQDKELMALIMSIQPTPEEIQKRKQLIKKK